MDHPVLEWDKSFLCWWYENLPGVAIRCGHDRPDEYGKTDGQDVKRGVITPRLLSSPALRTLLPLPHLRHRNQEPFQIQTTYRTEGLELSSPVLGKEDCGESRRGEFLLTERTGGGMSDEGGHKDVMDSSPHTGVLL